MGVLQYRARSRVQGSGVALLTALRQGLFCVPSTGSSYQVSGVAVLKVVESDTAKVGSIVRQGRDAESTGPPPFVAEASGVLRIAFLAVDGSQRQIVTLITAHHSHARPLKSLRSFAVALRPAPQVTAVCPYRSRPGVGMRLTPSERSESFQGRTTPAERPHPRPHPASLVPARVWPWSWGSERC